MSITLTVENFPPENVKETTFLNVDMTALNTFQLASSTGVFINDIAFLGYLGSETMERVQVSSITGQTVTPATPFTYLHRQGEPFTIVKGDQVKLYRVPVPADNSVPADTSFVPFTPVSILPDNLTTDVSDPSGSSAYWYKSTYYNTVSSFETDLALSLPTRGGDWGHYVSLEDVRNEAGFQGNNFITDSQVDIYRTMAENEVNATMGKVTGLPLPIPLPPLLTDITRMLGAGYLMLKSYGPTNDTMALHKDGQSKVDWGMSKLLSLLEGKIPLLDASQNNISAYYDYNYNPDGTGTDMYGVDVPYFTIDKRY